MQTGESPQSSSCGANSAEAVVGCESGDDMEVDVVTLDPPGAPSELLYPMSHVPAFPAFN